MKRIFIIIYILVGVMCIRANDIGSGQLFTTAKSFDLIASLQYFDKIKDPNLQCWYDDYLNVKATNGESFADQYKRVAAFLDEVRQKEAENIVVFAHGGVLICAQIYAKLIQPEEAFQAVPAYGGIFLYQERP